MDPGTIGLLVAEGSALAAIAAAYSLGKVPAAGTPAAPSAPPAAAPSAPAGPSAEQIEKRAADELLTPSAAAPPTAASNMSGIQLPTAPAAIPDSDPTPLEKIVDEAVLAVKAEAAKPASKSMVQKLLAYRPFAKTRAAREAAYTGRKTQGGRRKKTQRRGGANPVIAPFVAQITKKLYSLTESDSKPEIAFSHLLSASGAADDTPGDILATLLLPVMRTFTWWRFRVLFVKLRYSPVIVADAEDLYKNIVLPQQIQRIFAHNDRILYKIKFGQAPVETTEDPTTAAAAVATDSSVIPENPPPSLPIDDQEFLEPRPFVEPVAVPTADQTPALAAAQAAMSAAQAPAADVAGLEPSADPAVVITPEQEVQNAICMEKLPENPKELGDLTKIAGDGWCYYRAILRASGRSDEKLDDVIAYAKKISEMLAQSEDAKRVWGANSREVRSEDGVVDLTFEAYLAGMYESNPNGGPLYWAEGDVNSPMVAKLERKIVAIYYDGRKSQATIYCPDPADVDRGIIAINFVGDEHYDAYVPRIAAPPVEQTYDTPESAATTPVAQAEPPVPETAAVLAPEAAAPPNPPRRSQLAPQSKVRMVTPRVRVSPPGIPGRGSRAKTQRAARQQGIALGVAPPRPMPRRGTSTVASTIPAPPPLPGMGLATAFETRNSAGQPQPRPALPPEPPSFAEEAAAIKENGVALQKAQLQLARDQAASRAAEREVGRVQRQSTRGQRFGIRQGGRRKTPNRQRKPRKSTFRRHRKH